MVISLQLTSGISANIKDIGTVHLRSVGALLEAGRDRYRDEAVG
jgi:hypothetical protein